MKKLILPFLFLLFVTSSCNKEEDDVQPGTYEYFQKNLKASMDYPTIVELFGTPNGDIGSGIHIYVYNLKDGTFIWIGYSDHIHYARHVNSNQAGTNVQILHNII